MSDDFNKSHVFFGFLGDCLLLLSARRRRLRPQFVPESHPQVHFRHLEVVLVGDGLRVTRPLEDHVRREPLLEFRLSAES